MYAEDVGVEDGCTAFLDTIRNGLLDDASEFLFSVDAPHLQTGDLLLQVLT